MDIKTKTNSLQFKLLKKVLSKQRNKLLEKVYFFIKNLVLIKLFLKVYFGVNETPHPHDAWATGLSKLNLLPIISSCQSIFVPRR